MHRNIRRALELPIITDLSQILVELTETQTGAGQGLWIDLVTDVLAGLGLAMTGPDADAIARSAAARA